MACSECSSFSVECAHCGEPHEFVPSIMQKRAETKFLSFVKKLQAFADCDCGHWHCPRCDVKKLLAEEGYEAR